MFSEMYDCVSEQDRIGADLEGLTVDQFKFNQLYSEAVANDRFDFLLERYRVKLTWWKCWFWPLLPARVLGVDDQLRFSIWKIGHCLNCNANPYDGTVYAWSFDDNWYRGALIRCNRCGEFRWQFGGSGISG